MSPARQVSAGPHSTSGTECQGLHALTDCVAPLIRDLRERGLIAGYFFVNRWADRHIRLRLTPIGVDDVDEVCRTAEAAMSRYLTRRATEAPRPPRAPRSEPDDCPTVEYLVLEYAATERPRIFGGPAADLQDGSVRYHRYEPDGGHHGGPAGVDLAEWHFEHSSDLVLELVQSVDTHTRSTMLGLAAQLSMIMTAVFVPDTARLAAFLGRVRPGDPDAALTAYDQVGSVLRERFAEVRRAVAPEGDGSPPDDAGLAGPAADWAQHCHELRDRVVELGGAGALVFRPDPAAGSEALTRLLAVYLHGTLNRLGATPADEAVLPYLLARALRESENDD